MRHLNAGRKLNRTSAHRKALFRNQVTSLLKYERIETTLHKAKELRRYAEKTISIALRGKPNAQREVFKTVSDKEVIKKLFADIVVRIGDRKGGYTRIIPIGARRGDCAEMALIELVDRLEEVKSDKSSDKDKTKKSKKKDTNSKDVKAKSKGEKGVEKKEKPTKKSEKTVREKTESNTSKVKKEKTDKK